MGFIDSIEKVTEAKWYKLMMPKLYGWGAAVVILGALFKIEHLPLKILKNLELQWKNYN